MSTTQPPEPGATGQTDQGSQAGGDAEPGRAVGDAGRDSAAGGVGEGGAAGPVKTMRAVHSAILVFEAIVVGLAIPVAISLNGIPGAQAGIVGGAVAVSCLVAAGLLPRRIGYLLGSFLQVVTFALGFAVPGMFVLGLAFGALWFWCLILDRRLRRRFQSASQPAE